MPKSPPKLSIVTVNLNNCKGLEKTLASVQSQVNAPAYEQIVIDGGSTDGSVETIHQYNSSLSFWVSEPDQGIYHAMNKGTAQAKGDYLLFLNSGDQLANPTVLEKAFRNLPNADIIYGSIQVVRDGKLGAVVQSPPENALYLTFWIQNTIQHSGTFIKRSLLLENPYREDFRIVADRNFFFDAFLGGKTFARIDQIISHFDMSGISSQPRYAALKRAEWDKLFTQHMSLQVLSSLRNEIIARTKIERAILGTHLPEIQSKHAVHEPLRRWIDLFFLFHRFRLTRAALSAFTKLTRSWESRRQRLR